MRYRNNSNYKNDTEIRKKAFVSQAVLDELKRIITDAEVRAGRQPGTQAAVAQRATSSSSNSSSEQAADSLFTTPSWQQREANTGSWPRHSEICCEQ